MGIAKNAEIERIEGFEKQELEEGGRKKTPEEEERSGNRRRRSNRRCEDGVDEDGDERPLEA